MQQLESWYQTKFLNSIRVLWWSASSDHSRCTGRTRYLWNCWNDRCNSGKVLDSKLNSCSLMLTLSKSLTYCVHKAKCSVQQNTLQARCSFLEIQLTKTTGHGGISPLQPQGCRIEWRLRLFVPFLSLITTLQHTEAERKILPTKSNQYMVHSKTSSQNWWLTLQALALIHGRITHACLFCTQKLEKSLTECKAFLTFNYVTIRFSMCHFLLTVHWNRVCIFNRFPDIWPRR